MCAPCAENEKEEEGEESKSPNAMVIIDSRCFVSSSAQSLQIIEENEEDRHRVRETN